MRRHNHHNSLHTEQVEMLNTAKFTPREIDILACLVSGKSYKSIAILLTISPKTVEAHIHNIMEKLACHSRERIAEMIEHSSLSAHLRQRYLTLRMAEDFTQKLQNIAQLIHKNAPTCLIAQTTQEIASPSLKDIYNDLKLAGIHVKQGTLKEYPNTDFSVYAINPLGIQVSEALSQYLEKNQSNPGSVVFLAPDKSITGVPELHNAPVIQCGHDHPVLIFEILKYLLPQIPVDKIMLQFSQQWEKESSSGQTSEWSTSKQVGEEGDVLASLKNYIRKYNQALWVAIPLGFLVVGGGLWLGFKSVYSPTNLTIPARSSLSVPTDAYFLQRPQLLAQIEEKLSGPEPIQTVVLLAMGGMGKTTIARQYAKAQKAPVIWEIDCETSETLLSSFAHLAYTLSNTSEEKQELDRIKQLENVQEYSRRLIHFIQQKLKPQKQWILIFDNVHSFPDIENFYPDDTQIWGQGKILITTRNHHVAQNCRIKANNVVTIKSLTHQEQFNLFTQIIRKKGEPPFTALQTEQLQAFLKQLAPFPLDVSSAAYYIKNTGMSYQEYLDSIQSSDKTFYEIQGILLKEMVHYAKTRYNIITFTLKQLIKESADFEPLLFMISMVGSQKIPKDLLDLYKDKGIVNQFIPMIRKYSFITRQTDDNKQQYLSIHRSVQQIVFLHLSQTLSPENLKKYVDSMVNALEGYCDDLIHRMDMEKMRQTTEHLRAFLEHKQVLSSEQRGAITLLLGRLYHYIGDFKKAETYLENSLTCLHSDSPKIPQILVYIGSIKDELGDLIKSKEALEKSIHLYRTKFADNQLGLAWSLMQLGRFYVFAQPGDKDKTEKLLEESIAIYTKHYGPNYLKVILGKLYLYELWVKSGQADRAKPGYEKLLLQIKKLLGENHFRTLYTMYRHGIALTLLGHYQQAQEIIEKAYLGCKKLYPEAKIRTAWIECCLGDIYVLLGNYEKALQLLLSTVQQAEGFYGKHHLYTEWPVLRLAILYVEMGRFRQAKDMLEPCLKVHKQNLPPKHQDIGTVVHTLANAHKGLKEFQTAENLFKEAYGIYSNHYGKTNTESAIVLRDFGHLYILTGNYEKAEEMIKEALAIFQKEKHPESYKCFEYLGELYQAKGLKDHAKNNFQQALTIATAHFPKESAHIKRINLKLQKIA